MREMRQRFFGGYIYSRERWVGGWKDTTYSEMSVHNREWVGGRAECE